MTKVFLSLGSNIGDKKAYLESALNNNDILYFDMFH